MMAYALTSCPEPCHKLRLLKLSDGTEHLANQNGSRCVFMEVIGRVDRDQFDAHCLEPIMSDQLHR